MFVEAALYVAFNHPLIGSIAKHPIGPRACEPGWFAGYVRVLHGNPVRA